MDDTTAASVGFVLAGVAFATSLFGWAQSGLLPVLVVALLAAGGLAALGLRRYAVVHRPAGSTAAMVASVGVVAAAAYATFDGGFAAAVVLAALAGGAAAVFAYADRLGLDRAAISERSRVTAIAVFVGALGIVGIYAWGILAFIGSTVVAPGGLSASARTVLSTLASGAGTLTVVALYLRWSDRDVSFLDVRWPDLRGVGYVVVGTVVILGGNLAIGIAFQHYGVESASHTIIQTAEADPSILLALIPLSYLVIGPGEELLYRNVVQKSLREVYSPVAGIVVASAVFAAVHLPAYSSPGQSLLSTMNTLVIIFVLALILGAVYERTGNVVVAALTHGTFNAIAFAATYWQLTGSMGA